MTTFQSITYITLKKSFGLPLTIKLKRMLEPVLWNVVSLFLLPLYVLLRSFHIYSITGSSNNPWYLRDENAELQFLRRHKNFTSEIKTFSVLTWLQNSAFGDFESERDAQLCLSRNSDQLGFFSKCDGCHNDILGIKYRCLECREMDLCEICNQRVTIPVGHEHDHKMAELR